MARKPARAKRKVKDKRKVKEFYPGFAEEAAGFTHESGAFKAADPVRSFDLTISTVNARDNFAELLNRVAYGKRRVVMTRRGKPLVCVIPMEDVDFIEELEDIMDAKAVDDAKKKYGDEPTIPIEQAARQLGIKLKRPDDVSR
jgi:prevent-host-death family protein